MSTAADLVVSGRVRQADGAYAPGSVWIAGGRIGAVTAGAPTPAELQGAKHVDVGEAFVLPGAIDAHVHSYSHDGEGIETATRSAAAGGVTTIVEMPFDVTGPVKDADRVLAKRDIVAREAVTDVALLGTLWPGGGWRQTEAMAEAGVVGFKVSLYHTDTNRFPRVDDAELLDVMAATTAVGRTLCVHAENNEIVQHLQRVEQGSNPYDPLTHVRTRPPVSESLGVLTAMEIARDRGTKLHLCHMSIPRAAKLARWWNEDGADISLETCPHYLTFTADDMHEHGARLKINPPLRSAEHRDGLWAKIAAGMVDVISSDHAPWPLAKKEHQHILENASGTPGVETLVAVTLGGALQRDPDPAGLFDQAVAGLTSGPAERFGLGARKGRIAEGYDADLMVFRPDATHAVDEAALHSNAGWSPYAGLRTGGYVEATFLRGKQIWSSATGELGAPGNGQLVTRD
ncbi:dihydroorotase family protein [Agrococcus sp. HG114]|uniref:dihydroorotase n=1 Tax=Agrococcus sp. HG114 TaxID=2969757 RepID=UPI00215A6C19|nr:amidohydrolase family protein [Agrococcus sp. HG114]MCR8669778.1 amidohydrolase family protein [Agrococcus sp. HG114]